MQIARVLRNVHLIDEPNPVISQLTVESIRGLSAHVVGDRKCASRAPRGASRVVEYIGGMIRNTNYKALHEDSIDAVIQHPIEMAIHRLLVLGTEQVRLAAIGVSEALGGIDVGVFGQIWPHLER